MIECLIDKKLAKELAKKYKSDYFIIETDTFYERLYDMLCDLAIEYIENNNIDFDDIKRWENDEIINAIDSIKNYLDEIM